MAKKQIRPSLLPKSEDIWAIEQKSGNLRFSFKYVDLNHETFTFSERDNEYFQRLFDRLKSLSQMRAAEMRGSNSKALRCHPITWAATKMPDGFTHLNKQLRDLDAWQVQIEKELYGRLHGFFIDDVFFVVWFDPEHSLYSN